MDVGYDDDLLADINDEDNGDGPDHDYIRAIADELTASSITDLGCGTGILTDPLAKRDAGLSASTRPLRCCLTRQNDPGEIRSNGDWALLNSLTVMPMI